MSSKFIDTGREGIHIRRQDDGSVYIQTVDARGRFHSGVMIPARCVPEMLAQLGGAPDVIKGDAVIDYRNRRTLMADAKMPGLGEKVKFITNKGTEVLAFVTEAPPRPGLDKGVITGLYVLDPTGPYFRKDVEFRSEVGGWQWIDHSAQDAINARAAMDAPARKAAEDAEEVETSESAVAKAAAESASADADDAPAAGKKKASKKK